VKEHSRVSQEFEPSIQHRELRESLLSDDQQVTKFVEEYIYEIQRVNDFFLTQI